MPKCQYLNLISVFVEHARTILTKMPDKEADKATRSHPELVGDMSRVTLNYDLSKIPFVHF